MIENAYYMIEGGKPLELVRGYIAERIRVRESNKALATELGVEEYYIHPFTGEISSVLFKGDVHPDFKKPGRKGDSAPKKNTEWAKRFKDQKGYPSAEKIISKELGIPTSINYKDGKSEGWCRIGNPFNSCGFLYLGKDGPYVLYIPDIAEHVKEYEGNGYTVNDPAKSFIMEIPGCRRIHKEEWEILVLQHKLKNKD